MEHCLSHFVGKLDFFGLSYYAKISHDPLPITYIETPEKIKKLNKPKLLIVMLKLQMIGILILV